MSTLSTYFSLQRRYFRSINLERDVGNVEALQGYVLTERSADTLARILTAIPRQRADHAWTVTSVYGTGKSAFAHYLASVCAPQRSPVFREAEAIASEALGADSDVVQALGRLPQQGLLTAITTGQAEPLSWTIARALADGAERFWQGKPEQPAFLRTFTDWQCEVDRRDCGIRDQDVLQAIEEVLAEADTHLLFIVDELGKNLEFATRNRGMADLYLLQQIAEFKPKGKHRIHFLGILHQSFAGYSDRLSAAEQNEWNKIQGRFADIPFQDSPSQMTRLIGRVIDRAQAAPILCAVDNLAREWMTCLQDLFTENDLPPQALADTYPIHPIAGLVLPLLCVRYAQNDRSLFTFLTSDEPYALNAFLKTTHHRQGQLPTLQLHQLYDYFVESVTGLASRFNLQRWVEIQGLIDDARDRNPDSLKVLKTIGILNLVTSTGILRATPQLVALALCDRPDPQQQSQWRALMDTLLHNGLITYQRQLDELRLWEGSDFNVEQAIYEQLQQDRSYLADALTAVNPRTPLVVQRHYTTTGTLRYFEQRYGDRRTNWASLRCAIATHDGLILHWMDHLLPETIPALTADGKPLVVVTTDSVEMLQTRTQELAALTHIQKNAPELQTDGVARREVRKRLADAQRLLDETLLQAFDWSTGHNQCWMMGEAVAIARSRDFQSQLSTLCDRVYPQGIILDNELINRRILTTQGSKARRLLLEAMLAAADQPRLGLEGYGPEVAIYYSVLEATQIHRVQDEQWGFYPPVTTSGLTTLWDAMLAFCLTASHAQKNLADLYACLNAPPYGLKDGVIPVILAAILLHRSDDIGLYKDGTFIPVLGPEHFELLVKDPGRFSIKYFEIAGLRLNVFRDLEKMLRSPQAKAPAGVRNPSLLMVAKPLFSFAKKLPKFTLQTQRLSAEAQAVLKELQNAQEPDELLFRALPQACGFAPITPDVSGDDGAIAASFRQRFVTCLHEIQTAYDVLLSDAQTRLYEAFGIRSAATKIREDLQVRATYLLDACIEPLLKRFILAAVDHTKADRDWLEGVVMVVADKPPRSWADQDLMAYELALSDVARRFKNLEALQSPNFIIPVYTPFPEYQTRQQFPEIDNEIPPVIGTKADFLN
jgi:hypothetical protein